MSLWGNTDTANSAPKFLLDPAAFPAANSSNDFGGVPVHVSLSSVYFVDTTEAAVTSNRNAGIKTPGWNLIKTYGSGRTFVENLVSMKVTAGAAGDLGVTSNTTTEDSTVADS